MSVSEGKPLSVTIFRDLASEGWQSMEVYADKLAAALRSRGCDVSTYAPPAPPFRGRAKLPATYLWRTLVYPVLATRRQGQINHVIDQSYGHLVSYLDTRRTVVTCHDVAPLTYPDPSAKGLSQPLWRRAFRGMLRAAQVIADSESARRDLLRHARDLAGRVTVAHPGVDPDTFYRRSEDEQRAVRAAYHLPDGPAVLHVGGSGHRKNLETLLHSFALVRQRGVEGTLVQAGGRFTAAQRTLIARLGIQPWVRQLPFVAPADLPALYSLASVFVFPSWYEGFGLPVVEAMACGTPVVAADASSLPEVVGDAGSLVAPSSAAGFADAVEQLLSNQELVQELRLRGRERARVFTWERTAARTMQVYAVLGER